MERQRYNIPFFFHAAICPRLECNVLYVRRGMHLLIGLLTCSTSCTMSKSLFSQHSFNNGTTGRACNHTVRNTQKNSNYPVSSDWHWLPILNLIPVPPQVSSATFIWQQSRIPLPKRIVEILATVPESRFSPSVSRTTAGHWWRDQAPGRNKTKKSSSNILSEKGRIDKASVMVPAKQGDYSQPPDSQQQWISPDYQGLILTLSDLLQLDWWVCAQSLTVTDFKQNCRTELLLLPQLRQHWTTQVTRFNSRIRCTVNLQTAWQFFFVWISTSVAKWKHQGSTREQFKVQERRRLQQKMLKDIIKALFCADNGAL